MSVVDFLESRSHIERQRVEFEKVRRASQEDCNMKFSAEFFAINWKEGLLLTRPLECSRMKR